MKIENIEVTKGVRIFYQYVTPTGNKIFKPGQVMDIQEKPAAVKVCQGGVKGKTVWTPVSELRFSELPKETK